MKFESIFNLGDHAWCMKDNKPIEVVISAINIFFVGTNQSSITYNAKDAVRPVSWLDHTNLQESHLFSSKSNLLDSL